MKKRIPNLVRYIKRLSKRKIILLSLGNQTVNSKDSYPSKSSAKDYFEEFKEAIRSGDENLWRMWR